MKTNFEASSPVAHVPALMKLLSLCGQIVFMDVGQKKFTFPDVLKQTVPVHFNNKVRIIAIMCQYFWGVGSLFHPREAHLYSLGAMKFTKLI